MRILLALLLLLVAFPSYAEDAEQPEAQAESEAAATEEEQPAEPEDKSYTYSPDNCEFAITFPDEPYTSRRCEDQEKTKCYDIVSYTQVRDLSSTLNFRVICNPVDSNLYEDYSAEVMEATLRAMTKQSVVEEYNSRFREEEEYKQAGLVGSGRVGRQDTIYIAQLWIGKQSAFSVEAELIGNASEATDQLFSDILKSSKFTGVKVIPEPKKTDAPNKD